jgi:hypothetical protein
MLSVAIHWIENFVFLYPGCSTILKCAFVHSKQRNKEISIWGWLWILYLAVCVNLLHRISVPRCYLRKFYLPVTVRTRSLACLLYLTLSKAREHLPYIQSTTVYVCVCVCEDVSDVCLYRCVYVSECVCFVSVWVCMCVRYVCPCLCVSLYVSVCVLVLGCGNTENL